jgi:hypothetical protein
VCNATEGGTRWRFAVAAAACGIQMLHACAGIHGKRRKESRCGHVRLHPLKPHVGGRLRSQFSSRPVRDHTGRDRGSMAVRQMQRMVCSARSCAVCSAVGGFSALLDASARVVVGREELCPSAPGRRDRVYCSVHACLAKLGASGSWGRGQFYNRSIASRLF